VVCGPPWTTAVAVSEWLGGWAWSNNSCGNNFLCGPSFLKGKYFRWVHTFTPLRLQ
jgi:hypothetical protein